MDQSKGAAKPATKPGPEYFGPEAVDARWPPSWKDEEKFGEYGQYKDKQYNNNDPHVEANPEPIRFTEAERAAQRKTAIRGLFNAVVVQIAVSIVVSVVAFAVSGIAAGVSALVGAAVYAIPNALFAFRLILSVNKPGGANPVTFFLGEFFKITFAGLLIFVAASVGHDVLVWPAFLAGLVFALKSQWLALAFGRK
jgi:ATP synthase protein I